MDAAAVRFTHSALQGVLESAVTWRYGLGFGAGASTSRWKGDYIKLLFYLAHFTLSVYHFVGV